ncbi:MAG: hypothetical protein SFV54_17710 [Bryobacteraceae bacterium]|nr:hypothetical protein [Bryobacteraceae bacterium]
MDHAHGRLDDQVVWAASLDAALLLLGGSRHIRKAVVVSETPAKAPAGVHVIQSGPADGVAAAILEARASYRLTFTPAGDASQIEIQVKPLPQFKSLRVIWQ